MLNDQMRLLFTPADGPSMGSDGKLAAGGTTAGALKSAAVHMTCAAQSTPRPGTGSVPSVAADSHLVVLDIE